MSAILPKCYHSQGQPILLSFRSSKIWKLTKKATTWSKRTLGGLMGANELMGEYTQYYLSLIALIRTPFVKLLSTAIIGSLGSKATLWIYPYFCYPNKPSSVRWSRWLNFSFRPCCGFLCEFSDFLNFWMTAEMVVLGIDSILEILLTFVPEL